MKEPNKMIGTCKNWAVVLDVQKQIKQESSENYYFRWFDADFTEHTINVNKRGLTINAPKGFSSRSLELLLSLI